jgi:dTDP-4-amino-4,6-dideoxygalactose transaminase
LAGLTALRIPQVPSDDTHAHYRFYAFVRPEYLAPGWSRDRILEEIERAGIPCGVGSCSEIYLERAFRERGWGPASRLPTAKLLGETSLMFLVHPTLTEEAMLNMAEGIRRIVLRATAVDLDGVGS